MNSKSNRYTEIESVRTFLSKGPDLTDCIVQGLDLSGLDLSDIAVKGAVFLGCTFQNDEDSLTLQAKGATVFPVFKDLPYNPYRGTLYSWQELLDGHETKAGSVDLRIYEHFQSARSGPSEDIVECLAQRIHDHAVDDALTELLQGRKPVGIMGGHSTLRTDPVFARVAIVAQGLTRAGFFVVSGGGPGVMEAANLGAYLAPYGAEAVEQALKMLAEAPHYTDDGYTEAALAVLERYPDGAESLAIPTWFYGHEPSNVFGSAIAKYFANSLREDGLLAIATYGVIYAPGSAGTLQEVFMDLCQNHYATFEVVSPMVFMDHAAYEERIPLWQLLQTFSKGRGYQSYMALEEDPEAIVSFIESHPPVRPEELSGPSA